MKPGDKAAMVDGPMIGEVVTLEPALNYRFNNGTPEGPPVLTYTYADIELPNGKIVTIGFYEEPRG